MMYRQLKWLVRRCYHHRRIAGRENYLKLTIRQSQKKIMLSFDAKPATDYRRQLRLYNFRWSRTYRYWHAWLNTGRLEQVTKIYRSIYRSRFTHHTK